MNIYIAGISGTGMGPLALMAVDAGNVVCGSDLAKGAVTEELIKNDIQVKLGVQDGTFLKMMNDDIGVDWFVYTSALPKDHPELLMAKKLGLKISKRDELISYLVDSLDLKMIAVAGTHGKTTTAGMLIWTMQQLGIPVSYLVGTTLPFAPAGKYEKDAEYFVYEADEYDRNFLNFYPWLAAITVATFDHPDIYKTREEYKEAFLQFEQQSRHVVHGGEIDNRISLAGEVRRIDATLAFKVLKQITNINEDKMIEALNHFPGVGRRFEHIDDGVYSDYAHHPEEIKATIQMAIEEAKRLKLRGVIALYEPHQNSRQHTIFEKYKDVFEGVDKLYWLPTFLVREDPDLKILEPQDFIANLTNKEKAESADMNDNLEQKLLEYHKDNYLILLMTAGPADLWLRSIFGGNAK